MKTLLAAVAAAAVLAGAAQAATPEQRIAALERQVAVLAGPQQTPADRRIAALERRVRTLETSLRQTRTQLTQARTTVTRATNVAAFAVAYSVCLTATTADAFSGTWSVIDQIATTAQAKTYFTPQAAVSDADSCRALEITRAPTVPPTLSPFSALTALLT